MNTLTEGRFPAYLRKHAERKSDLDADRKLLSDAADEIERLRAALERISRECSAMNKGPVAAKIAHNALHGPINK